MGRRTSRHAGLCKLRAGGRRRAPARAHVAHSRRLGRRDAAALQPVQGRRRNLQGAGRARAGPRRSRHRQGTRRVAADHARAAVVPRQGAQAGLRGPARGARRVSAGASPRITRSPVPSRCPCAPQAPERILLGGSPDSALAARNGWRFCYAGHFNGDDANLERSLDAYRSAGGTRPLVALYAVAAPTRDAAEQLIGPLKIFAAVRGRPELQSRQRAGGRRIRAAERRVRLPDRRVAPDGAGRYARARPPRARCTEPAARRRCVRDRFAGDRLRGAARIGRMARRRAVGHAAAGGPRPTAPFPLTRTRDAPMTTRRSIPFGLMLQGAGSHMNAWRHPSNPPDASINLDFAIGIARKAEAAGIAFAFVADGLYINEKSIPHFLNRFEPLTVLSALAVATKKIGARARSRRRTASRSRSRQLASLDAISGGRAGWNVVTTPLEGTAKNFGRCIPITNCATRSPTNTSTSCRACGTAGTTTPSCDRATGRFFDRDKLHTLDHHGRFFQVAPAQHPALAAGAAGDLPGRFVGHRHRPRGQVCGCGVHAFAVARRNGPRSRGA